MNWKEFFKLSITKVVIFLVLGIIAFFTEPVQVVCVRAPCPPLYSSTFSKVVHLILVFPHIHSLFGLVLNIIYLYLLTSVVAFGVKYFYKKYKK